ncbi:hypothetical protein AcW1_005262 [Taiwanofungus camphoratus]|nr:hypothetical protein AcW2_004032 [Antrodia cinnamomea]KAI0956627.1 hypothetical protein AcW1_005262 [Antrodia cinnamomea]
MHRTKLDKWCWKAVRRHVRAFDCHIVVVLSAHCLRRTALSQSRQIRDAYERIVIQLRALSAKQEALGMKCIHLRQARRRTEYDAGKTRSSHADREVIIHTLRIPDIVQRVYSPSMMSVVYVSTTYLDLLG